MFCMTVSSEVYGLTVQTRNNHGNHTQTRSDSPRNERGRRNISHDPRCSRSSLKSDALRRTGGSTGDNGRCSHAHHQPGSRQDWQNLARSPDNVFQVFRD